MRCVNSVRCDATLQCQLVRLEQLSDLAMLDLKPAVLEHRLCAVLHMDLHSTWQKPHNERIGRAALHSVSCLRLNTYIEP